jgi:sigma54-dependent transcription regulator
VAGRGAAQLKSALNCAALPEALVESALFGHVRGAFSGAVAERSGKFELPLAGRFLEQNRSRLGLLEKPSAERPADGPPTPPQAGF